jgi:glucose/arabinose dehydrogenase
MAPSHASAAESPQGVRFEVEGVATNLRQPTAMVFPSGEIALLAERESAAISRLELGSGRRVLLENGFESLALTGEDAGLHDLALHPRYAANGWIYASYSTGSEERSTLAVDRFRLRGDAIVDRERVFAANAFAEDRFHYGGRLAFAGGHLFVTVGDRHHPPRAQSLSSHAGKILRLHDDGRVPGDNPFVGQKGALPEIWSYGHRNPQGLAIRPDTGDLWAHEHGPLGGDELNLIRRGANYGWPVISYGWEYTGGPIGMGITRRDGMEQPAWVWTPAIAPSGLVVYRGSVFPAWRGSFLIGSMARQHLNRIALVDGRVALEERLLPGRAGRARLVAEGPDGFLYVGNDNGELFRLRPP